MANQYESLDDFVENCLSHHGVLGMKWGRRKAKVSSTRTSTKKKKKSKPNYFTSRRYPNAKDPKKLTIAELRSRIDRMNLENQYVKLNSNRLERMRRYTSNRILRSMDVEVGNSLSRTMRAQITHIP